MPADLERIFQIARERRNWREPPSRAASATTGVAAGPPVEPPARVQPSAAQIFAELEAELTSRLGPRLPSVRVQLAELRAACADELGARTAGAPRTQKAHDQHEALHEALLKTGS